jgi:hypothetical protein
MITLELTPDEAALLRDLIDAHRRDLLHEIHHTDDRAFREHLRHRSTTLDRLAAQLGPRGGEAAG